LTEKFAKISTFFKQHHLLIPFYDVYGNPISLSGRTLLSDKKQKELKISKYKHLPFIKRFHLFGLNLAYKEIVKKDKVIIVEGQFDAISCYIHGIKNVVALCGSKLTFEQIVLLKRFTNNFDLLLDNDEAGEGGFEKANKNSEKLNIHVNKISIPSEYKDIDLCLKDGIPPEEIFK
jgi:DNA primase